MSFFILAPPPSDAALGTELAEKVGWTELVVAVVRHSPVSGKHPASRARQVDSSARPHIQDALSSAEKPQHLLSALLPPCAAVAASPHHTTITTATSTIFVFGLLLIAHIGVRSLARPWKTFGYRIVRHPARRSHIVIQLISRLGTARASCRTGGMELPQGLNTVVRGG
ncbi:uncharacterized protein BKA78DRAFT_139660 [Phyllosticta capitalensis]|uniref:uncharacterized protein n=1 Tax=Phyllosticta capitalensis TaxID=121624 RepID=UPI00312E9D1D